MFDKGKTAICPACLPVEEADYEKVRQGLQDHPEMNAEDLAASVGVDMKCIMRFLDDGRIETTAANAAVVCGRCGAPAISISKRLCKSCLNRLDAELTTQVSQISLGKKKNMEVGSSFKTGGNSSTVKFQR